MELRDRWGRDSLGNVNINLMPPNIRREYAKHDYHPRERNLKGAIIQIPALAILMFLISGGVWIVLWVMDDITGWFRKRKNNRQDRF